MLSSWERTTSSPFRASVPFWKMGHKVQSTTPQRLLGQSVGLRRKCVRRQEALPTHMAHSGRHDGHPHRSSPQRLSAYGLGQMALSLSPS